MIAGVDATSAQGTAALIAGAGVLGAIVGSFLGATLVRLPAGRSVVTGRSACDSCGKTLSARELVPLLSWLAQGGKCRACGAPIGAWQLGAEIGAALVAMGAVAFAMQGTVLAAMLLGWQLLLLALLDARHMWLPRMLTALLVASGVTVAATHAYAIGDLLPLELALLGGALGFAALWLVAFAYRRVRGREGMGGGDPPLMGAIGVWLGPQGVILTILGGTLIGLVAVLALFVAGRKLSADSVLPLGTCLAIAAWPLFVWGGGV